jgi:uncharacterized membrane-anchored protein
MFKKALMVIGAIAVLAAVHTYARPLWDGVYGLIGQALDQITAGR